MNDKRVVFFLCGREHIEENEILLAGVDPLFLELIEGLTDHTIDGWRIAEPEHFGDGIDAIRDTYGDEVADLIISRGYEKYRFVFSELHPPKGGGSVMPVAREQIRKVKSDIDAIAAGFYKYEAYEVEVNNDDTNQ